MKKLLSAFALALSLYAGGTFNLTSAKPASMRNITYQTYRASRYQAATGQEGTYRYANRKQTKYQGTRYIGANYTKTGGWTNYSYVEDYRG